MNIQGIILFKNNYKERDLFVSLLRRDGRLEEMICYRAAGGGKKQASSIMELGFCIEYLLQPVGNGKEIKIAKEWSLKWGHQKIRNNYQGYLLLCFYLELIKKIAQHEELHAESEQDSFLFTTLSNALFSLDQLTDNSKLMNHLQVFLSKLIGHLGIYPELELCALCGSELKQNSEISLGIEKGGFQCQECSASSDAAFLLRQGLLFTRSHRYQECLENVSATATSARLLLSYFLFHFQFSEQDFRALPFL